MYAQFCVTKIYLHQLAWYGSVDVMNGYEPGFFFPFLAL